MPVGREPENNVSQIAIIEIMHEVVHLEPLVVASLRVHENLQRIDFERVRALTWIIAAVFLLAGFV